MAGKELAALKKFEEAAAACNRCGFCTSYCPTYNATGNEAHSPRGRNQLVRALMEGKIKDVAQVVESVDSCLLCGECTSVCFSEVPTAQLMMQARNYIRQVSATPATLNFFLKNILPNPHWLAWILKLSFLGKKLGIAWLLKKAGVLGRMAPMLAAADELVASVPFKFLLDYSSVKIFQQQIMLEIAQANARKGSASHSPVSASLRPKIAYVPVCGSQYLRPSIGLATINLFKKLKIEFVIPEAGCCGLPAASIGAFEEARSMAQSNISRFEQGHFESVVVDDTSCATHLKDLPKIFQDDVVWLRQAHELAQKVRDLSTTLIQKGLKDHLKLAGWGGGPVAFHDPCKAQYTLRLTHPPRELLSAIPNLKLVPVAEADQCCGGAGGYSFMRPEMSQAVLAAKAKNLAASGCSIVVTSSASCLTQLAFGLRKKDPQIQVLHLTEFLVRALEKRK